MDDKICKEKVCQEEACVEHWEAMSPEVRKQTASFTYCPFCANEMITRCSGCGEAVHDFSFKFCPWCGKEFEE